MVAKLRENLTQNDTGLFTHDMPALLLRATEACRENTRQMVRADIVTIKGRFRTSLDTVSEAVDGIKETTSDLRYLALNVRIEAARAGDQERGFDIVAQQVERSVGEVRDMAHRVDEVSTEMASISEQIEAALAKLK